MGIRLKAPGAKHHVGDQVFEADANGVIELPDEHAEHAAVLIESHGFVPAPDPEQPTNGRSKKSAE